MAIQRTTIFLIGAIVFCAIQCACYADQKVVAEVSKVEESSEIVDSDQPPAQSLETPPALDQAEASRIKAIQKAVKATVGVFGPDGQGGGSGVVISPDGYALTNYHVVDGSGAFMKCSMPDGVLYDAVIVGIDPTGDVAVVKLLGRDDFPTATIADK